MFLLLFLASLQFPKTLQVTKSILILKKLRPAP